jgi:hypothetical protein
VVRRQGFGDHALLRVDLLGRFDHGFGRQRLVGDRRRGVEFERHLAVTPGAPPNLHRDLEQGELVGPGREAAYAAALVQLARAAISESSAACMATSSLASPRT